MNIEIVGQIAVALGLGMLIGMERERTQDPVQMTFAGVRTFSLLALLGAISITVGVAAELPWLFALVLLIVAGLVITSYRISAPQGDIGITTEVSALLTLLIGALCALGQVSLAGAIAVVIMVLLASKDWFQKVAQRIDASDVTATLKFAIITLIILPLVPDVNYGPEGLQVLNPYKTWLMVVLIAGLNFAGYLLVKIVGSEHGLSLTGLLGGLLSSTAVTLSFSQRSRSEPELAPVLALAILLAWTIMYFRVVVEVAVINLQLAISLAVGMLWMGAVSLGICFFLWRKGRSRETAKVETGRNPFELREAIKFGGLFAIVIFVASAAQRFFGDSGLYIAGALAGLTDVDAIALSMADMALRDPARASAAATTIVIAVISNTLVKCGMTIWIGAPRLRKTMVPITGILTGAGIVAAWLVGYNI